MRDLHKAEEEGNERAKLAVDMLCYQIKKYIGFYSTALGGLDAVVFTGGIGDVYKRQSEGAPSSARTRSSAARSRWAFSLCSQKIFPFDTGEEAISRIPCCIA